MNKGQSAYRKFKDFLFRNGLLKKSCYVIKKYNLNSFVSDISETDKNTCFTFCNNIDNSMLFDDLEAACSYVSVYNVSDMAVDLSGTIGQHSCFLLPVVASRKHNKNSVSIVPNI